MVRRRTVLILVVFAAAGQLAAADVHPLQEAKAGDWARYAVTIESGAGKHSCVATIRIAAVKKDQVTIRTENVMDKKKLPPRDVVVDLSKPYQGQYSLPEGVEGKIAEEGKEQVTLGDKTYDCTWVKVKASSKANGVETEFENKIWRCPDVPLHGVVKAECQTTVKDLRQAMVSKTTQVLEAFEQAK